MKKTLLLTTIFFFLPHLTFAYQTAIGDQLNISSLQTEEADLYAAGANVRLETDVPGDLVIGGAALIIDNNIGADLLATGGNITVNGNIGDDARLAGGQIDINGQIGGDVMVVGGQITIGKEAIVIGDLGIAGGQVVVYGTIRGNAEIYAGNIILGEGAHIMGDLNYSADQQISGIKDYVSGAVHFEQYAQPNIETSYTPANRFMDLIFDILQLALLTALLYLPFQRFFHDSLKILNKQIGWSYLWGTVTIMAGWIPMIFLMFLSVALGIWWFATWMIFFIFLYKLFLAVFATAHLIEKHAAKTNGKKIAMLCLATASITLLYALFSIMSDGYIFSMLIFIALFIPLTGAMLITKAKVCQAYLKGKVKI